MNIQQFQYIIAVADSKNFEAAAKRCHITQSTLSTMIGRFEKEIDIKIFNRTTKPVTITPEGQKIINRLRLINNEIDQLGDLIQELKGEMVGELRIGIIPTIAPYLLPLFLNKLASKFPKVNIIVNEITTAQITSSLKDRSLDIGILALPINDKDFDEHQLYIEPFLVYDCRTENFTKNISVEDIDYSKLWLLKEGHCLRTQVYEICDHSKLISGHESNFEFESGSMDSLLRFTKANQGMTIIPYLASLEFSKAEKKRIVGFNTPSPSRSIGLLTHKFFVKKTISTRVKYINNERSKT